jgi:hypothetical protein
MCHAIHRQTHRRVASTPPQYRHVSRHHIYLIYRYVKSKREDLTPQQVQVLAKLMKDVKDG